MSAQAEPVPERPSVIVVDDHADVAELIRIVLEREGYAVRCTPTAEAALGIVETRRPDLVISDVHMPGMSGIALAAELRRRRDPVSVLLMSVDRFRFDDGTPFLPKPFSLDALVALVGAALAPAADPR